MKNSQIAIDILKTLEKEHINLYHDVSKDEILDYLAGIENLDELSDIDFDYVMLKMFALFKDAHTNYFVPPLGNNQDFCFRNDKFYIYDDGWKEIKKFGSKTCDEVYKLIDEITPYETVEWLNVQVLTSIKNMYIWNMLGIENYVETVDGKKIEVDLYKPAGTTKKPAKDFNKEADKYKYYDFEIIKDNILRINYQVCRDNEAYPFKEFVSDIRKEVEEKNIKNYVLDLRGNMGGNSEIINPLRSLVKEKNLNGVVLINNEVFSSGTFAVMYFKKDFNAPLIGEPTGGPAKAYGNIGRVECDGKRFTYSKNLYDFSKFWGYTGAIQPDIYVKRLMEDRRDKALEVALNEIEKMKKNAEKIDSEIKK